MGLLDNYFDPETMAAIKQMNQPSAEDRMNARNNGLMNAGFAMMMNNGGRNSSQAMFNALGAGGMAGVGAYQGSLDTANQQRQHEMQQGMQFGKLAQEQKQRQLEQLNIQNYANSLDPKDRPAFLVDPKKYIENNTKPYTLGQGDVRFGQGGVKLAEVAAKPEL